MKEQPRTISYHSPIWFGRHWRIYHQSWGKRFAFIHQHYGANYKPDRRAGRGASLASCIRQINRMEGR